MKLNEFLDDLKEAIPEYEIPEYDSGELKDAIVAEKPDLALKKTFGEAFWPKIQRWLDQRLKGINVPPEASNYVGGPLKYKLDQYLQKEEGNEQEYEENVEALVREILESIEEWGKKVVKDPNLPPPKM
jgi:hypothetical protein